MSKKAFSKIMWGLEESKAYMEGERDGYKEHRIEESSGEPKPKISAEESARRALALDQATGHLRMEGLYCEDFTLDLDRHYISGELEAGDAIALVKEHYGVSS